MSGSWKKRAEFTIRTKRVQCSRAGPVDHGPWKVLAVVDDFKDPLTAMLWSQPRQDDSSQIEKIDIRGRLSEK